MRRWKRVLIGGMALLGLAWVADLAAEEAASPSSLFGAEQENIVRWARLAGILAAVLALGLVLSVVFQSQSQVSPSGKWLLLLGVIIFPAFNVLIGWQVGLHHSKTVASCASCHTMAPYLKDMTDPNSRTLAAEHFQNRWIPHNQCYECHTSYGFLGDIEAKWSGLGHVYRYYTHSYEQPIRATKPYGLINCLGCHEGARRYNKIAEHGEPEVVEGLRAGKITCLECHNAPHPRPQETNHGNDKPGASRP